MVIDGHGYVNNSLPPIVPSETWPSPHGFKKKKKNLLIFKVTSNKRYFFLHTKILTLHVSEHFSASPIKLTLSEVLVDESCSLTLTHAW